MTDKKQLNANYILAIKWAASIIIGLATYIAFPDFPEAPKGAIYMGITMWGVSALAMEIMASQMLAVGICTLYILTKVGVPRAIMAPWTSNTVWMIFAGVLIGHMTMSTGLARRIALNACSKLGGSYGATMLGLVIGGVVLGPVISSAMGKCVVICAVALGCCQALNLKPMSKEATGLLLTGFLGVDLGRLGFLTGGGDNLMLIENFAKSTQQTAPTWVEYFLHNFPPSLLYALIGIPLVYIICRPKNGIDSAILKQQAAELPRMSGNEIKGSIFLVILMCIFLFEKSHGMNIAYLALALATLMFVPGINLINEQEMKKVNLWMVVFIACCMCIGAGASTAGVDKVLAKILAPYMQGSDLSISYKYYITGLLANFLLTPLSAISALSIPMAELATELKLNALPLLYSFNHGLAQLIFPYEVALLLYFYATGYMRLKTIMFCLGARMLLSMLVFGLLVIPYWTYLGLFKTL